MSIISIILVIIIITIGWSYFSLAKRYKRNKVLYVFLGVGTFVFVVLLNAVLYSSLEILSKNIDRSIHRLITFVMGVLIAVIIHYTLEKKLLKEIKNNSEEAINEIGNS